ncbi:hypothetical protein NHX12_019778 [Muraenolepis orangiensis]|uniref:Uncharacterized protein n=1 Tax=Muraenolepis orangiensis TaxID=630683 RepID=A0A9Q0EXE0_9TELE|nr:hypothetical protein NHX12_019778 [Muraenolepis orangiensis]
MGYGKERFPRFNPSPPPPSSFATYRFPFASTPSSPTLGVGVGGDLWGEVVLRDSCCAVGEVFPASLPNTRRDPQTPEAGAQGKTRAKPSDEGQRGAPKTHGGNPEGLGGGGGGVHCVCTGRAPALHPDHLLLLLFLLLLPPRWLWLGLTVLLLSLLGSWAVVHLTLGTPGGSPFRISTSYDRPVGRDTTATIEPRFTTNCTVGK